LTAQLYSSIGISEFKFLCCCARTHFSHDVKWQIKNILANKQLDWNQLIKFAFLHQIAPLLYQPLKYIHPSGVPGEILSAFEVYNQHHLDTNKFLTHELLDILQSFDEKGIIAVPFKGPLLAEEIYGDIRLRVFRDLDFLIQKQDIPTVLAILKNKSYRLHNNLPQKQLMAFWRYAGQDIFHRCDNKVSIEPHWAFAPSTLAIDFDYAALFQRLERTTLEGVPIYTFTPEDTLIILCIHGSKELWVRLKWICDIAQFLETYPNIRWDIVFERAIGQGCLRMVYLGLLLAHQVFGSSLSENHKIRIGNDKVANQLASKVRQRLFAEIEDIDIYQISSFRWRMREQWCDRWAYLWRTLTTPRVRHFSILRLPDAFYWGYYPLKIAHDYLAEPVWTLIKLIIYRK
jgi:hypothetical protein